MGYKGRDHYYENKIIQNYKDPFQQFVQNVKRIESCHLLYMGLFNGKKYSYRCILVRKIT